MKEHNPVVRFKQGKAPPPPYPKPGAYWYEQPLGDTRAEMVASARSVARAKRWWGVNIYYHGPGSWKPLYDLRPVSEPLRLRLWWFVRRVYGFYSHPQNRTLSRLKAVRGFWEGARGAQ